MAQKPKKIKLLTSYFREAVLVVDCINSDWFVFFITSGDVAVLRLYNPSEQMKRNTSSLKKREIAKTKNLI